MKGTGSEGCQPTKNNDSQILDPQRKRKLMKKLEKIKLNRSYGNNSFLDVGAFYDLKLKKLKNNNVSLAKALADQRQVSQSWYDEVVSLKEELQDCQENLLRYRVNKSANCDVSNQAASERRLQEIAEPLDSAVQDCLDNVLGLVEGMTKVKQLVSLLKTNNSKARRSASYGSSGSRPPLSRTPKSPRKNVVHPMVEGHVLQPAAIHIPRMTLEERKKYRLQERAESREDAGMSVIGENSPPLPDVQEVSSPVADPNVSSQATGHDSSDRALRSNLVASLIPATPTTPTLISENISTELLDNRIDKRTNAQVEDLTPISFAGTPKTPTLVSEINSAQPLKNNVDKRSNVQTVKPQEMEDPLEGSSWMHLKKRKYSRKRKGRSRASNTRRTSSLHLILNSSDSDLDDETLLKSGVQNEEGKGKRKSKEKNDAEMKTLPSDENGMPKLCLVRLDEHDNNVSRRTKSKSGSIVKSEEPVNCEQARSLPLVDTSPDPFLTDTLTLKCNGELSTSNLECLLPVSSSSTTPVVSSPPSFVVPFLGFNENKRADQAQIITETKLSPFKEVPNEQTNITCLLEASMDFTQCIKEDLKAAIAATSGDNIAISTSEQESKETSNCPSEEVGTLRDQRKRSKRFFKGGKEESLEGPVTFVKTVYDLSMNEMSIINPITPIRGKENIPPELNGLLDCGTDESSVKLKQISVVVEDIMKTPSSTLDTCPDSARICTDKERSIKTKTSLRSASARRINFGMKRKETSKSSEPESPMRNVSKRRKNLILPRLSASSPANVKQKRKTAPRKKATSNRKGKNAPLEPNATTKIPNHCGPLNLDEEVGMKMPMKTDPKEGSKEVKRKLLPSSESHPCHSGDGVGEDLILNDILEEVTNLTTILGEGVEYEPRSPPHLTEKEVQPLLDLEIENEEDEIQILAIMKSLDCDHPVYPVRTSGELVKARPRRAAAKVASMKEPRLNTKLRQERPNSKSLKPPRSVL